GWLGPLLHGERLGQARPAGARRRLRRGAPAVRIRGPGPGASDARARLPVALQPSRRRGAPPSDGPRVLEATGVAHRDIGAAVRGDAPGGPAVLLRAVLGGRGGSTREGTRRAPRPLRAAIAPGDRTARVGKRRRGLQAGFSRTVPGGMASRGRLRPAIDRRTLRGVPLVCRPRAAGAPSLKST